MNGEVMSSRHPSFAPATLVWLTALALGPAKPVQAALIVVNTLADTLTTDGACSLREAIYAANIDTAIDECPAGSGDDTIRFGVSGTVFLGSSLPEIAAGTAVTLEAVKRQQRPDILTVGVVLDGGNVVRVLRVEAAASLTIKNLTIANGFTAPQLFGFGGGIHSKGNVTVINSRFVSNRAMSGGGAIYIDGGNLEVDGSVFSDNHTYGTGGAILLWNVTGLAIANSTFSNNEANDGGAMAIDSRSTTGVITGSTFSGNHAESGGGGIFNVRSLFVYVANSTFSGNKASREDPLVSGRGGGIFNWGGEMMVVNSTFTGNRARVSGGGIQNGLDGGTLSPVLYVGNTILANSPAGGDCANGPTGSISVFGVNLVEDGSCALPGALSGLPSLGPLRDNGGPTKTHGLLSGSIAIDRGDNAVCATFPVYNVDQRGSLRPKDGDGDGVATCDIGALEGVVRPVPFPLHIGARLIR
jgi:CSLREA domain-containing protein